MSHTAAARVASVTPTAAARVNSITHTAACTQVTLLQQQAETFPTAARVARFS